MGAALRMLNLLALALPLACLCVSVPRYKTNGRRDPDKLNVHIVCHTHDDPGWLKTFEQYVFGQRPDIQVAGVNYVLDAVVDELPKNPDRKFVYGEMIFLSKWWSLQTEETKATVKQLVDTGQLEFVNGGWVQNDEATAHYVGMIDQMTRGHQFIKRNFGVAPRVGWQIDTFGHSSTQASLMSAEAGFDGLFFGRIDYQEFQYRVDNLEMEFLWRASKSMGASADIFTSIFSHGNIRVYLSPEGFGWEWGVIRDTENLVDDKSSVEYNVPYFVDLFYNRTMEYKTEIKGNDLLLLMGGDFGYATARMWFDNLDKLIHYVNEDGRLNVFYSTPATYVDAKNAEGYEWTVKTNDFFPHADSPHCYWTGYYTSRPTSKKYVRMASSYLQAARQLEAMVGVQASGPATDSLEYATSLCQHHDSITGTEKQHVDDDYNRIVAIGLAESRELVMAALTKLASETDVRSPNGLQGYAGVGQADGKPQASTPHDVSQEPGPAPGDNRFQECRLLNSSICGPTVEASREGSSVQVVAYNSLAWARGEPVRVPLAANASDHWTVTGPMGEVIPSQTSPVSNTTQALQSILLETNHINSTTGAASKELSFIADVPPLGFAIFTLSPTDAPSSERSQTTVTQPTDLDTVPEACHTPAALRVASGGVYAPAAASDEDALTLDNGILRVAFDASNGRLVAIDNLEAGVGTPAAHTLQYYNSYDAGVKCCYKNDFNPSGAYLFRPNDTDPVGKIVGDDDPVRTRLVKGPVVQELVQEYAEWASVTWRLWANARYVEMEWTVGPIPMADGLGKEVISRFNTSLVTEDTFYTDSNGREMLQRIKDVRQGFNYSVNEPVSSNYYPVTAASVLRQEPRDNLRGIEFSILTDRSHGSAALDDGVVEVMLQRTTTVDDWRGVEENMNETMCGCRDCDCVGMVARGVHHVTLQADDRAAELRRNLQQRINDPLILGFSCGKLKSGTPSGSLGAFPVKRWSMVPSETFLPPNVHLLTLKAEGDGHLLVRLAHLFQVEEGGDLSEPVTVDLAPLLGGGGWTLKELTVTTAHAKADVKRLQWKAKGEPQQQQDGSGAGRSPDLRSTEVTLAPMEIKTLDALKHQGTAEV